VVNHPNRNKRRPRLQQVCAYCRGSNVSIDATGVWNFTRQRWEASEFDETNAYCIDCGGETRIEEVQIAREPQS